MVLVYGKEDVVPSLTFNPEKCYRRTQLCCYRYVSKAKHCKQNLCTYETYCAKTKGKYCTKHRQIRTCKIRCYDRMKPVYECTPNELVPSDGYVHAKEYLEYIPAPPEVRVMN